MLKFILKRLLMAIPVLLGVTFIVFTIMSFTPGDPVQTMLGDNYTQEAYEEITEELGLNDPFLVRYVRYVVDLVQGDMGTSYSTKRPVADEIFSRFPATVRLAEVSTADKSIFQHEPRGRAADAYRRLTKEVLEIGQKERSRTSDLGR